MVDFSSLLSDFQSHGSPFEFAPRPTQDTELLQQLKFIPGFKEVLILRQVHALEHATVWLLSDAETSPASVFPSHIPTQTAAVKSRSSNLSGLSTSDGFYLYGALDLAKLRQAVPRARQRLTQGEWDLAVHPRCGTNFSVGMLLMGGLVLGLHWLLPRGPIEQLLGLGLATMAAASLAPEVGSLVQRYITTAIPFNLEVREIVYLGSRQGTPVHFVRVAWVEA